MPGKTSKAGEGPAPALLQLCGISRTYGDRQALQPLDLQVQVGTCTALFGHNGSGKSTLLRIAAGRDKPTTGTALFDGRVIDEDAPEVRARVAVVGDTIACYPDLSVHDHLKLITVAHDVADADGWIDQVLADRRLEGHAHHLPSALSSGQMQAFLLAAALVRPRDLLVLDEPEQRLDPDSRRRLSVYRFAERLEHVAAHGDVLEAIRRALPAGLVLLALSLAVIAARDALWRGPVIVPGPVAAWLLSQPVDRTRVLRPYFRLTAGLAVVGGVLCAVAGGVLLRLTGLSSLGPGVAACLPAGLCLPLLAVVLALQVERRTSLGARVRAWTPYAVLLLVVLVAQTAWAATGHRFRCWSRSSCGPGPGAGPRNRSSMRQVARRAIGPSRSRCSWSSPQRRRCTRMRFPRPSPPALAVGRLVESARLEADDLRRSSWSPFCFATLMLHHAIVPAGLGAVLACMAAVPFALNGAAWALLLMPVCALPFAAASVVAAVRGPVRSELLFIGMPTPFGDLSFFVFLIWYAAPLLISVTALSFTLEAVLTHGAGVGALACMVLVALALTAVLLLGASHLAKKLRRH
ncbi:DUF6297 family protein [Streptomyces libani]|uniref:ABC transporter ATP-binding protein n=1 Tax=Streptomyces nigrescens TaxID=1920 RepID=UPI0038263647